jgi:hypothetical protein
LPYGALAARCASRVRALRTLRCATAGRVAGARCGARRADAASCGQAGETIRVRRGSIWLILSGGLLAIFCMQELLESLFTTGHPDGLHGVFGHGGWLAIPLSTAVGGIAAGFVRLAVKGTFRGVATAFITLRPLDIAVLSHALDAVRPRLPLLRQLAGRAPPLPA